MSQTFPLTDFIERYAAGTWEDQPLRKALASLPSLSPTGPWLAGGALRRTVSGAPLESDFDFFFASQEQLDAWKAALPPTLHEHRSSAHNTEYRGALDGYGSAIVQAIHFQFYTDAAAVIDSFDYTICQLAFDGVTMLCGDYALWDIGRKRLAVHRVTYPVASMRRLIKYTSQGYTACAGAMATLLQQTANSPALMSRLSVEYVD